MRKTAGPCRWLAPQTWSVLDFIRTDLRTLRIHRHGKRAGPGAQGGRMATPATGPAPIACRMKAGIHFYRRTGQPAWKEHLISTLAERTIKRLAFFTRPPAIFRHPPSPDCFAIVSRDALISKQGRRERSQRLFKTIDISPTTPACRDTPFTVKAAGSVPSGCSKQSSSKAAASEGPRRTFFSTLRI